MFYCKYYTCAPLHQRFGLFWFSQSVYEFMTSLTHILRVCKEFLVPLHTMRAISSIYNWGNSTGVGIVLIGMLFKIISLNGQHYLSFLFHMPTHTHMKSLTLQKLYFTDKERIVLWCYFINVNLRLTLQFTADLWQMFMIPAVREQTCR